MVLSLWTNPLFTGFRLFEKMSHTLFHSVIDVECVNSVSNRSKDIISFDYKRV